MSKFKPVAGLVAALALAGCGGEQAENRAAQVVVNEPVVATYDGGMYVIDGETLEVKSDVPIDGFLRVNPAGDDEHVMVSTDDGFTVLDAAEGRLTDTTFAAAEPGHVVPHGDRTALFADGTGEITVFNPNELANGAPKAETFKTPQPHHGVAVVLDDGTQLRSDGDPDVRSGAVAVGADGREIARTAECPGIHGEAVVGDDTVVFGCENGVLVFTGGKFNKIAGPGEYGRVGTVKGHHDSPVALGDFKVDPDAELERPNQFSLIDTERGELKIVKLPAGVSYSFRSLARGPHAEALILGTDGNLYVIDPATGNTMKTLAVTQRWTEPDDWQQPRPTVFTRAHDVYVTDTASNQIHLVDVETGEVSTSTTLEHTPNELSGAIGEGH
jgi:DNA-binding beta-propeller fold protein YncE